MRLQIAQVGIAGQDQLARRHGTASGMHLHFGAMLDPGDAGLLVQAHPQALGCGRFAQQQIERMQMARTHVGHAADIEIGIHHLANVLGGNDAHLGLVAEGPQLLHIGAKILEVPWLVGQVAVAPDQIAVDGVLLHPLPDQLHGFQPHQFEIAHALLANDIAKLLEAVADATDQLAAVAPAGTPANLAGLQQHHTEPAFGQLDSRIDARITATDDADVRVHRAGQRRAAQIDIGGSAVPGRCRGVLRGVCEHDSVRLIYYETM